MVGLHADRRRAFEILPVRSGMPALSKSLAQPHLMLRFT